MENQNTTKQVSNMTAQHGKVFKTTISSRQTSYTPHKIVRLTYEIISDVLEAVNADTNHIYSGEDMYRLTYNALNMIAGNKLKPYESYNFKADKPVFKTQQPTPIVQDLINGVGVAQTQNVAVADTSNDLVELFRSALTKKEEKAKRVMTTEEIQAEIENSTLTQEQKALLYDNFVKPALEIKAKKEEPALNFFV